MVPANANGAVTPDARAQATAGERMPIGCCVLEVDDDAYRIFPEGSSQYEFATGIRFGEACFELVFLACNLKPGGRSHFSDRRAPSQASE
jgi:hypothetical protein